MGQINIYTHQKPIFTPSVSLSAPAFSHALAADDEWKFSQFFLIQSLSAAVNDMKIINSASAAALMRCRPEINYQIQTWSGMRVWLSVRFSALCFWLWSFCFWLRRQPHAHHPSFDALFTHAAEEWKFEYIGEAVFAATSVAEAARFPARLTNCALSIQSLSPHNLRAINFHFNEPAGKKLVCPLHMEFQSAFIIVKNCIDKILVKVGQHHTKFLKWRAQELLSTGFF